MRRAYLPPYNDSDMNYKKLLPLCAIALLTSTAFTACSTDTPKTEKTDEKKDPHTDGSTGATKKPGTPVTPTPADPKENLPALREGEIRVAVPQAGSLEAALKGKDLTKVRTYSSPRALSTKPTATSSATKEGSRGAGHQPCSLRRQR